MALPHSNEVEPAKEYARLVQIKHTLTGSHVNVTRIRLYDNHRYNWHSNLISHNRLFTPTDQTHALRSSHMSDVRVWDEIWLDGICIYKKSLLKRLLTFWKDYRV